MSNDMKTESARDKLMTELGAGRFFLQSERSSDCDLAYAQNFDEETSALVRSIIDSVRVDLVSEMEKFDKALSVDERRPNLMEEVRWVGINLVLVDVIQGYLENPYFAFMVVGDDSVRCVDTSLGIEVGYFMIPPRDYLSEEDAELLEEILCGIEDAMTSECDDDKVQELDSCFK